MKKIFAILVSVALMLAFSACASSKLQDALSTSEVEFSEHIDVTIATTEKETFVETTAKQIVDNPEKVKELLTNVFTHDDYETVVTVEDNVASVFLIYYKASVLYSDFCDGDQESLRRWDAFAAVTLDLHDIARDLTSSLYGDYTLKTYVSDANYFPYLSITDGKIDLDLFHMGEQ